MAYSLPLPARFKQWRVKIHDLELVEPPHVHILRKTESWRLDLRTGEYMDDEPDPSDVPDELRDIIDQNWAVIQAQWDAMYPENLVQSQEGEEDDDA